MTTERMQELMLDLMRHRNTEEDEAHLLARQEWDSAEYRRTIAEFTIQRDGLLDSYPACPGLAEDVARLESEFARRYPRAAHDRDVYEYDDSCRASRMNSNASPGGFSHQIQGTQLPLYKLGDFRERDSNPVKEAAVLPDGGCPICGASGVYKNVGRRHWFYCLKHRTKWSTGENLISSWQFETKNDWKENEAFLADFREVEPICRCADASDWKAMIETRVGELEDRLEDLRREVGKGRVLVNCDDFPF
jgi:hypothetical protein